jgi:hypothetical protein
MGLVIEEDRKRKPIELTLRAARKRQSPQTGFVHHCYEADTIRHDTIPLFENFCFILALLRSRQSENMLEGIALLHKLLAFEQNGHFPVYLHEFPICKDRMLGIKLLAVFQAIIEDFYAILETSLHDQLQQLICRIHRFAQEAKAQNNLPSRYAIYLNNLKNREFGKEASQIFRPARAAVLIDTVRAQDEKSGTPPCQIPDSSGCLGIYLDSDALLEGATPDQMVDALIAARGARTPAVMERIAKNWHGTLMTFIGPQEQERTEPKVTLFDLFLCDYFRNYPARVLTCHPVHLRASLIYATEKTDPISHWNEVPHQSITSHPRQPYTLYWGSHEQLHSLVCDPKGTRYRIEEKDQGAEFLFKCIQPCSQDGPFEIAFFCNLHTAHTFLINGCKATTFQFNDVVEIHSEYVKIQIVFSLAEGEGIFFGHLSRGNRPLQIAAKGDLRYEAFDCQIGLRTINRTDACVLRAHLSWSKIYTNEFKS